MEVFILVLSSLITLLSPVNLAADKIAERLIRAQFQSVEQLKVRVDNTPVQKPANGQVDRIRIAGRGLFPVEGIRVEALELETDPINVSRTQLLQKPQKLVLEEPLGVAVRVVIRRQDVLQAFRAPIVRRQIRALLRGLNRGRADAPTRDPAPTPSPDSTETPRTPGRLAELREAIDGYRISNPTVEFLGDQRVEIGFGLEEVQTGDTLRVDVKTGIDVLEGRQIRFVRPTVQVNGQLIPDELLQNITQNVAQQLNLDRLERILQVRARILQVRFAQNSLEIAAFVGLPAGFKL